MISIKDLKETNLFRGLKSKQLQPFMKHFIEMNFQAGEVIFSQGDPAQDLYILSEGEVTLGIKTKGEIDLTAYSIGKKGEVFGLPCLIKPYRNNVSAVCKKRTKVFVIHGEILRRLMMKSSRVGLEMMEKVTEIYYNRLNSTRAMIANLFKMFKFQTGKSTLIETYYED
jgi:CRP/FNR family cyclic AMP-dependent transcriptional regulator